MPKSCRDLQFKISPCSPSECFRLLNFSTSLLLQSIACQLACVYLWKAILFIQLGCVATGPNYDALEGATPHSSIHDSFCRWDPAPKRRPNCLHHCPQNSCLSCAICAGQCSQNSPSKSAGFKLPQERILREDAGCSAKGRLFEVSSCLTFLLKSSGTEEYGHNCIPQLLLLHARLRTDLWT